MIRIFKLPKLFGAWMFGLNIVKQFNYTEMKAKSLYLCNHNITIFLNTYQILMFTIGFNRINVYGIEKHCFAMAL